MEEEQGVGAAGLTEEMTDEQLAAAFLEEEMAKEVSVLFSVHKSCLKVDKI